jgi:hypothetical protein
VAVTVVVAPIDSIQFSYTNHKCPIIVNKIHKYLVIANISCIKIMDFLEESSFMKDLSAKDIRLSNILSNKMHFVTCLLQIKLFR